MRPSSSVTKIARANPMSRAAYAMDRNPATSASAVPPTPSPPTSPVMTPIAKNSAAISLNPQPKRSTPTTSAAKLTSTSARTAPRQQQHHRHERDDLLLHVVEHPAERERERSHGHDQRVGVPEAPHQPVHALPQRAGLVDHGERAADQEHEEDHGGRVGHAPWDRDERLERSHGARCHGVIGARDYDPAAGRGVVPAVVLTGRPPVTRHGGEQHAAA